MKQSDKSAHLQMMQDDVKALIRDQKIKEAITKAEEAIVYSKVHFGPSHINTASCYSTLGACLSKDSQDEKGKEVLENALAILLEQSEDCRLQMAQVKSNLSVVYRKLRMPRKALLHATESVELRIFLLGLQHPDTATSISNLGYTLSFIGLLPLALRCYTIAVPFDSHTQSAKNNFWSLTKAITDDSRFVYHEEILIGEDAEHLDIFKILAFCRAILEGEKDDALFLLKYGQPAHAESYVSFAFQLKTAITKYPLDQKGTPEVNIIERSRQKLYRNTELPLHTVKLLLKRIERTKLGILAQTTLKHAFPNFGTETTSIKQKMGIESKHKSFNNIKFENLRQRFGADAVTVKYTDKQYRRYAGDNNLPPSCYYSVCISPDGNDGQTMCRELYEYTDLDIPGYVWLGDSWDAELMEALGKVKGGISNQFAPGIYVFILPPVEPDQLPIFQKFYAPILELNKNWDGLNIIHIPVDVKLETIDRVIDLRQEETQDWFCHFFKKGDGAIFTKYVNDLPKRFTDMLPTLVYPEFGGSGVTKSIGSWMRLAGVYGLIYPSARSDVKVEYDEHGKLKSCYGWNFVDYRNSHFVPDKEIHFDIDCWHEGFVAGRQAAPKLIQNHASWMINGAEERYLWERKAFIELLAHTR